MFSTNRPLLFHTVSGVYPQNEYSGNLQCACLLVSCPAYLAVEKKALIERASQKFSRPIHTRPGIEYGELDPKVWESG